jgi:hypothetical protein
MAKRARGSTSRPGQRAPLDRSATSRRATTTPGGSVTEPRSSSLTDEEEARAAELEARIVAEERAAEASAVRSRREAATASEARVRTGTIVARAAEEYAYVARDLRRIVLIGGSLLAFLIGLWVVTEASGAAPF